MKVKSVTILILGIVLIGGLAADNSIEYKPHTDNYDITTIYKTTSAFDGGKKGDGNAFNISMCPECYDVTIHLRTNAIGMPIEFNGRVLSSDKKSLEFVADSKYPSNFLTRNEVEYNVENWNISTFSMSNKAEVPKSYDYNLLLWKADKNTESFKIKWEQRNTIQTCISVSYLLENVTECTLAMYLVDESSVNKRVVFSNDMEESNELKTVLFKSNNMLYGNQTYSLNFKLDKKPTEIEVVNPDYGGFRWSQEYYIFETVYADSCVVGIKRIAQCTDDFGENEETLKITVKELQKSPSAFNVYPFDYTPLKKSVSSSLTCLNGGFAFKNGCTCPTGFEGDKCEYGCGPNAFGVDCTGRCSIRPTHCRQMMICTNGFGCKCPAGYSGENCTTECTNGTYGVNCEQQCSEGCNSKACDVYTGVCNNGCATSYITPDCIEKYPWLNSPPQLESSDFKSLQLKIDFNSENINGSMNVNLVYYQIIFKAISSEAEFHYLELKEIGQQKSVLEIIDNLQPGILYSFGVILIAGDGNYNIEDTKMVNYSTKCIMSKNLNHNVNLLSGPDHINVTWNKLLNDQHDDECKVTNYLLKLMHNYTTIEEQNYSTKENSFDSYEYMFKNLVSSEKYGVYVTAQLATGQAIASKTLYTYTMPYGFVQIKNIKAKLNQSSLSLTVTWDVDKKHKNTPLNFTIKYKANKHLSCSNEVIKSNWTLLSVYNQTLCDILDLIPNTQYVIKVDPIVEGYTYKDHANIIFVKTNISIPKLIPEINDENDFYVTNQNAYFNWTINMTEKCSDLNGFFRGYHVVLKDVVAGTQVIRSIKQNTVNYDGLKPDTKYELWIYVLTNYGFNFERGLLIPFKTKTKILMPVGDLRVYKKDLINKSIGIRWSFYDESIINGFIVVITDKIDNSAMKQTIEKPKRCVPWPQFYCTTFDNLIQKHQYTIEVKATSLDYPTGGLPKSILSKFIAGRPDEPLNIKAKFIGSTYITLEWDIPLVFNGILKSFTINIEKISFKDNKSYEVKPDIVISIVEEIPTYNYTINDLKPGSTYTISVSSSDPPSYDQYNTINVTTITDAEAITSIRPGTLILLGPDNLNSTDTQNLTVVDPPHNNSTTM